MTLTTRVHLADPVNPERLFVHLLDVLARDPNFEPSWERQGNDLPPWGRVQPGPLRRGRATYKLTRKGEPVRHPRTGEPLWEQENSEYQSTSQGLAAIIWVAFAEDGPLRLCDDDELDGFEGPMNEHLVSVSFDTPYGYMDSNGASCGDLHAFLLREVGDYLARERMPIRAVWNFEFDGTWHPLDNFHVRGNPDRSVLNAHRSATELMCRHPHPPRR